ncbi:nitroreductase family protein [Candidatus Peregrinibacteria bacterium]|nr:nitroreductase family protein [Candidatus Peregrinibacteria bacterium]
MDFFDVVKNRHSVREFDSSKKVSDEMIEKILEAAKLAPSAGGLKSQRFYVVKDAEKKQALSRASLDQEFVAHAYAVFVIAGDKDRCGLKYGDRGKNLYVIQDAAAAAENMFLTATALGLASCWVGAFDEKEVQKILGLAPNIRPMVIMPVGYAL